MIIDGETVITGSFNFTKAAEENSAKNLLVIRGKKLTERYTKNWQERERHSEVYMGARENSWVMDHREHQAKSLISSYKIDKKVTLGYLELLVQIQKPFIQSNYDGCYEC
jgi:phosphatidylserine/phosphatidylglycerophosphate/cardiolipin synthase-like enzyme